LDTILHQQYIFLLHQRVFICHVDCKKFYHEKSIFFLTAIAIALLSSVGFNFSQQDMDLLETKAAKAGLMSYSAYNNWAKKE